jgi:hypothetical protein
MYQEALYLDLVECRDHFVDRLTRLCEGAAEQKTVCQNKYPGCVHFCPAMQEFSDLVP